MFDERPSPSLIAEPPDEEERFLLRLGFSKPLVAAMKRRAMRNGTTIETELLACGHVRAEAYYGALARVLHLPFMDEIDAAFVADTAHLDSQLLTPAILRCDPPEGPAITLIVPEARHIGRWRRDLGCRWAGSR